MNLKVEYDKELFIVQINGNPLIKGSLRSDKEYSIKLGDVIRISTTYKRNWFVNGKAIGLQDKEDDAMYQNVYTIVTSDSSVGNTLTIAFKPETNGLAGDYLPHSVADVNITCPHDWRFFKSSSTPTKSDLGKFKDMCAIWDFGEYVRQLGNGSPRFKRLNKVRDYYGMKNVCGVVKEDGAYIWISTGNGGEQSEFLEKKYSTLSELTTRVPIEFLGMKPVPHITF